MMLTMPSGRVTTIGVAGIIFVLFVLHLNLFGSSHTSPGHAALPLTGGVYRLPPKNDPQKFDWARRQQFYPVQKYISIPQGSELPIPRVQYAFEGTENRTHAAERRQRRAQVKFAMKRSWDAYREHAWLEDELTPVTGGNKTAFGGWAAT
jgi:mannosyl-oligosaccharide alpha-1,2-mannosidase